MLKEKLSIGDRVMLYYMKGETISPGTEGIVRNILRDPFNPDGEIIEVDWDNGSSLSLLSDDDVWKILKGGINESNARKQSQYVLDNEEIFDNYDWKFIYDYLKDVRNSGIVNMFGAAPLLFLGSKEISRKFDAPEDGENTAALESFEKVLQSADEIKNKLIQGSMRVLEKRGKEFDIDEIQKQVSKSASKLLNLYMVFF